MIHFLHYRVMHSGKEGSFSDVERDINRYAKKGCLLKDCEVNPIRSWIAPWRIIGYDVVVVMNKNPSPYRNTFKKTKETK